MLNSRPGSTSTRQAVSPLPRPQHQVNTQTKILDTVHGRILCIADIRGRLAGLNDLARDANAKAIIHTGDFGFFESSSLDRINDRTLRHLTMYSPLISSAQRSHLLGSENSPASIRATVDISLLSEFPLLLAGQIKLDVPVYTVWGACEDVAVIQKFRSSAYTIENLHIIDEATTRCIDVGGVKLRLLGLGGALVPHKMFDNGDGEATIAGGQGTMWTTALQIGELVDTAQRIYDPSETRLLVTHASPGREGIIAQLALVLKADLTISAGLHFRYATSYNEFSVQGDFEGFRHKLVAGKDVFDKVWESVKPQVDAVVDDNQRVMLDKALSVVERLPPTGASHATAGEEPAWKNCWNWNLCDAAYGSLILDIKEGRVSSELKSQGFNYAYRRSSTVSQTPNSATSALPAVNLNSSLPPTKSSTPAPNANTNGTPAASTPGTNNEKVEREKQKRKEKKERKDRERVERDANGTKDTPTAESGSTRNGTPSGKNTPLTELSPAVNGDELKSPLTEGSTGGARTPKKGPARNPWTLWMRMPAPATEPEVREFFGEAKGGITKVNYPISFPGRAQRMCYVEFGDEEAMKAGLEKHAEKLNDGVPEVKVATDREQRAETSNHRGGSSGGRARGGRGGGYAARGFAAAGLTRGNSNGPST